MQSRRQLYVTCGAFLLVVCSVCANTPANGASNSVEITSPDGKNQIALKTAEGGGQLLYRVARDGKPIVDWSPIDMRLANRGSLSEGLSIEHVDERSIDETSELPWGKSRTIRDHCREANVRLKSRNGFEWQLALRAYDDGVAFRYGFLDDPRELLIESENTEFRLAGDPSVFYMTVDQFHNSHEALYERKPLSSVPVGKLIDKPLLAIWPNGTAAAISEARLRDFAGMYLERM